MCGRFVGYRNYEELRRYFPIDAADCDIIENYNVAPSQEVLVIINKDGSNRLTRMHWGLVPFWANDISIGNKLINARAETIATKPSFRQAFARRRCLILADGFYEWKGPKGEKHPMYITLPDETPFAFAGLWETWRDREKDGPPHTSCAIITTAASESILPIHHRMPAILKQGMYADWLNPEIRNSDLLQKILVQGIHRDFISRPVSKKVGSVRTNAPSNIQKSLPGF